MGSLTLGLQGSASGAPAPGELLGLGLPLGLAVWVPTRLKGQQPVSPYSMVAPEVNMDFLRDSFFFLLCACMSLLPGPLPPMLSPLSRCTQTLLQAPDQSLEGSEWGLCSSLLS